MNISGAAFKLSSDDVKSIIDEFVKVPGLRITAINIEKGVTIEGNFRKLIKIPFKLSVSIVDIKRNSVSFKLERAEIIKLPIFNWIKDIALKKVVKTLKDYGIFYNDGNVDMHLEPLLKTLPISIKFYLKSIELQKDALAIEVEKILLRISNDVKASEQQSTGQAFKNKVQKNEAVKKEDLYGKFRQNIDDRSVGKIKGFLPYIMIMPDIIALFIRLFKDKRVPLKVKLICGSVLGYLTLPLDVLPDFLPVIGKIDDVALAFFALDKILCSLPKEIIIDNWQGKEDIIMFIRSGTDYIYRVIGASNIVKSYKWLTTVLKLKSTKRQQVEIKEIETDGKEGIRD